MSESTGIVNGAASGTTDWLVAGGVNGMAHTHTQKHKQHSNTQPIRFLYSISHLFLSFTISSHIIHYHYYLS